MTLSNKARIALKRACYTSPSAAKEIADAIDGSAIMNARFASAGVNVVIATNNLTAVDGVTPVAGDIALLKDQSTPAENGLYKVVAAGPWTRLKDAAGNNVTLKEGLVVDVAEGTANADTEWTLGSDLLTWSEMQASTTTPNPVGTTSAIGTSKQFALGDHVHANNPALCLVYKARAVVIANVASLAAFVVTQDGVTLVQGDVVLLANQTTPAECGLYTVGAVSGTAPLTRVAAMAAGATIQNGCVVEVSEGTLFAGSTWKAMCTGANVVGTNDPLFYPRTCRGILTLASGTKTLGSTEGLFLFSTTRSVVKAGYNTAGGTVTSTVGWRAASASRTAGKSGTAAVVIIAIVAAGTIDAANNSTMDWEVSNW